tara:strand:- start:238 stop:789 length:552 start_codon:yes stop_codon:yes gene_type:complete
MLEILIGTLLTFKTFLISSTVGILGGIKVYTAAAYLFIKPAVIYSCMRFTYLVGIATVEWWSGRLYSIHCIGTGVNGFYNHIFQIASPACTGLLTTHIGLMGVLVASFVVSCIWGIYNIINKIKSSTPGRDVINEYNDVKGVFVQNSNENKRFRSPNRSSSTTRPSPFTTDRSTRYTTNFEEY